MSSLPESTESFLEDVQQSEVCSQNSEESDSDDGGEDAMSEEDKAALAAAHAKITASMQKRSDRNRSILTVGRKRNACNPAIPVL